MKKNKIIVMILIILLLLIFIGYLTYYKLDTKISNDDFIIIDINEKKEQKKINYINKYSKYVIDSIVKSYDYEIIDGTQNIYGKIYIDDNQKLYVVDKIENKTEQLSKESFKTIYKNPTSNNEVIIYAITIDGSLYKVYKDIKDTKLIKIDTKYNVDKFTQLIYKNFLGAISKEIVILTNDNKMYEANSNMLYEEGTFVAEDLYIYNDSTISKNGYILQDKNKESYKVKSIIEVKKTTLLDNAKFIIITSDNKLIYTKDNKIYEHNEQIKQILKTKTNNENKYKITFKNNKVINILGFDDPEYYSILS